MSPDETRVADQGAQAARSLTRAFLFADLREYTRLVETHGAARAAELLERYRSLVREAVGRFQGSEIKTEGDSFYVVFDSVSAAVQCALRVQVAATDASAEVPDPAIRVGIGIHAGETVAVADGYVGSAVNVAARICAQAKAGEILVSETVRTLTQSVVPVTFETRGRHRLKGVEEPVAIFAVVPVDATEDAWASGVRAARARRTRRRRTIAGIAGIALLGVVAIGAILAFRPPPGLPPGEWAIALDMPLVGGDSVLGNPIRDAVRLAMTQVPTAGDFDDARIALVERESTGPDGAESNASSIVSDPRVVAMIGPLTTGEAEQQIPVTNAAGLLQCSPSATYPFLTKPRFGALDIRQSWPDRINFVRTVPSDDIQAKALASFILHDLGVSTTLLVLDTEWGSDIAGQFSDAYQELGGTVVRRSVDRDADPGPALDPLFGTGDLPGAVFYAGSTETGAAELRQAMASRGLAAIPFLSFDTLNDGSGARDGSYIQRAGSSAVGTYMAHAAAAPSRSPFPEDYRAAYGKSPGEYDAAAYACVQVIVQALEAVAKTGPSPENLREAVRAHVADPTHRFDTVLGTIGFDDNGDSLQQFVTFYRVDPSAAEGKGDWVIHKTQDYGPAP